MLALSAVVCRAEEPLQIELVSEVTSIRAGEPFYVGLALHHGAGYHSYWKFPGIVGVPTNIEWLSLPAGFKAEPIDWPEPEHVLMFSIHAQGYERDVVLPIRITPPATLTAGTRVRLAGKATWMCCSTQCNPGFKDLAIELPVANAKSAFDATWHAKFEAERALRPRASQAWQASAKRNKAVIEISLKPQSGANKLVAADATNLRFFTEDGMVDSNKPQTIVIAEDGSVHLTLLPPDYLVGEPPATLRGVLLLARGWEAKGDLRCLRISPPLLAK